MQRGLRPGQLAALLGAANCSKVGSLIRSFELGGPISDHWLEKLIDVLKPDPDVLRRCLELDQEHLKLLRQVQILTWEKRADQAFVPTLSIRFMAGVGRTILVPDVHRTSRELAESWAASQMKSFKGLRGVLRWKGSESTVFSPSTLSS
jgi:hypothetical protein